LSAVRALLEWWVENPSFPIYSNILLKGIPYRRVDNVSMLFDINTPCFMLLDELWHIADSHKAMTIVDDVMSMLLLRSGKKHWRVYYTQQFWTQTEKRIRFVTEEWVNPEIRRGCIVEHRSDIYGRKLPPRRYACEPFYEFYDHEADPFTLNLEELRELWHRDRRRRGLE
jgi:hypothetical protein